MKHWGRRSAGEAAAPSSTLADADGATLLNMSLSSSTTSSWFSSFETRLGITLLAAAGADPGTWRLDFRVLWLRLLSVPGGREAVCGSLRKMYGRPASPVTTRSCRYFASRVCCSPGCDTCSGVAATSSTTSSLFDEKLVILYEANIAGRREMSSDSKPGLLPPPRAHAPLSIITRGSIFGGPGTFYHVMRAATVIKRHRVAL